MIVGGSGDRIEDITRLRNLVYDVDDNTITAPKYIATLPYG